MPRLANTCARAALQAPPVVVEVHISPGLPTLNIVGLPETSVRESKDRVRSAFINSGYEFPEAFDGLAKRSCFLERFSG